MASALLHSMSGSSAICSPVTGVRNLFPDTGKRLQAVRSTRYGNLRKIFLQNRETTYTVCRRQGNQCALLDGSASGSTWDIYRRKEMKACRSMTDDAAYKVGRSSSHIGEPYGAGGETTSECLYLKRTICDGEIVEHSGSVIILGDVKQGGYVSAGGDVIVLGRLEGTVQAGKAKKLSTVVFTASQDTGIINIGDEATLHLAENESFVPHVAVLASDGRILIQPAIGEAYDGQNFLPDKQSRITEGRYETVVAVRAGSATQLEATPNKKPAQVALFTGIYISVAGLVLFAFPKLFGILFDLQGVSFGWIQVGAVLAVVFGVYYIGTAVGDMRGIRGAQAFYYSTVVGRMFLFLSFAWLVITGAVPAALLLVGVVNLVGAGLMWRALSGKQNQVA